MSEPGASEAESAEEAIRLRRGEMGKFRREQIIEAAVNIIAQRGLQHLSLGEIEKLTGLSRGQLTYYFPTKEAILLAVFDRMRDLMLARIHATVGCPEDIPSFAEGVAKMFQVTLLLPPLSPEFHALQHTFLSQIGHREDYRAKLAEAYGEWRSKMASDYARDHPASRYHPRVVASLLQALAIGLGVQRAADPNAFDGHDMLRLIQTVLQPILQSFPEGDHGESA